MRKIFTLLSMILLFGCKNEKSLRYERYGSKLRCYRSNGNMEIEKNYIVDTIFSEPHEFELDTNSMGAEITYINKSTINKWLWYERTEKFPTGGFKYELARNNFKLIGSPFIRSIKSQKSNSISFEAINPKMFNVFFKIKDSFNLKSIINYYTPTSTDTTCWCTIDNLNLPYHTYYLSYILVDQITSIPLDSLTFELSKSKNNQDVGVMLDSCCL